MAPFEDKVKQKYIMKATLDCSRVKTVDTKNFHQYFDKYQGVNLKSTTKVQAERMLLNHLTNHELEKTTIAEGILSV